MTLSYLIVLNFFTTNKEIIQISVFIYEIAFKISSLWIFDLGFLKILKIIPFSSIKKVVR
jgi:hypothetical protein